ncbi:hypothetical protein [Streptomyces sp. Ru71]|uniref:hypothetical protein n=1 Tax=Streptomyces sp. Ru71 TaxID=2080746 RepID=UPI00215633BA|nr:hypothetical protein [Streptomyces sp. Ru71]
MSTPTKYVYIVTDPEGMAAKQPVHVAEDDAEGWEHVYQLNAERFQTRHAAPPDAQSTMPPVRIRTDTGSAATTGSRRQTQLPPIGARLSWMAL